MQTHKQGRFRIPGNHNGRYIFHFHEVHCSHAYFSPDANKEHLNKSVLTSSSAARLGLKFILSYLLMNVTGLLNARLFFFFVTEDKSGLKNLKQSLTFCDNFVYQLSNFWILYPFYMWQKDYLSKHVIFFIKEI